MMVAQALGNRHNISAVLQHVSRKAVSEPMWSHLHFDAKRIKARLRELDAVHFGRGSTVSGTQM